MADGPAARTGHRRVLHLRLDAADFLVPAAEGHDHLVGLSGSLDRVVGDQVGIFGRPNSAIAFWLLSGAMSSGTSFTAGPG
jgi:hypothetical protein